MLRGFVMTRREMIAAALASVVSASRPGRVLLKAVPLVLADVPADFSKSCEDAHHNADGNPRFDPHFVTTAGALRAFAAGAPAPHPVLAGWGGPEVGTVAAWSCYGRPGEGTWLRADVELPEDAAARVGSGASCVAPSMVLKFAPGRRDSAAVAVVRLDEVALLDAEKHALWRDRR